jgi:hypothetical protein
MKKNLPLSINLHLSITTVFLMTTMASTPVLAGGKGGEAYSSGISGPGGAGGNGNDGGNPPTAGAAGANGTGTGGDGGPLVAVMVGMAPTVVMLQGQVM